LWVGWRNPTDRIEHSRAMKGHVPFHFRGELLAVHTAATTGQSGKTFTRGAAKTDIEKGGIDVRAPGAGGSGVTPLHCAVGTATTPVAVVAYLLDQGADPTKQAPWFNEGELVDAFEIALEGIEFLSFFRGGDARAAAQANKPPTLAQQKIELLLTRFASAAPDIFCKGQGASVPVPLVLSPDMRVRKCIVGAVDCAALLTDSGHGEKKPLHMLDFISHSQLQCIRLEARATASWGIRTSRRAWGRAASLARLEIDELWTWPWARCT
jgi:hypothetical protein